MIPAFDGRSYARCTQNDHDMIFRLDEPSWTRMLATPRKRASSWSVAADGALYASEGRGVVRCEGTRPCIDVAIDMAATMVAEPRASYGYGFPKVVPQNGRMWHDLRLATAEDDALLPVSATTLLSIETVLARSRADVWALGTAQTRRVLLHLGANGARTPVRLPTEADTRVRNQNERTSRSWTPKCDTTFVRSDAELRDLLTRRAELASLVSPGLAEAAIVAGRLGTVDVRGILLVRAYGDDSLAAVQESAKRISARLGSSSSSLGCTPPVLSDAWRLAANHGLAP
jgi:hypothetical protein